MLVQLKDKLRKHEKQYSLLYTTYHTIRCAGKNPLQSDLNKIMRKIEHRIFVQIGSNDGIRDDPLHDALIKNRNWSGIFVEPMPKYFEKLQKNYGYSRKYQYANHAIGSCNEQRSLYYVSENARRLGDQLPDWYDLISSFEREHLVKHANGILEPFIEDVMVDVITLDTLKTKFGIKKFDLIVIDAEGHDWDIFCQIDFSEHKPKIIILEHKHIADRKIARIKESLDQQGYVYSTYGANIMATLK